MTAGELDDSEVAEAYMDAKFGGGGADMVEIVGGGRDAPFQALPL